MTSDAHLLALKSYGPDLQPTGPLLPLEGNGGLSGSRLWRYSSARGERLLRAWPREQPLARIEAIHRWLRQAGDLAFVAQPFAARDGRTARELEGVSWEIDPWLAGSADLDRPPRAARVRAAFRALGMFHARFSAESVVGVSPGLRLRGEEIRRLERGGFEAIASVLKVQAHDPCRDAALEWLALSRKIAPAAERIIDQAGRLVSPLHPCLRDARPEHFLFDGDRVTGLVDFGAMDVESASADVARLAGEWLPLPTSEALRADGLTAYMEVMPVHPNHAAIAAAFEVAADLLIAERWIRWRFREGRRFDDPNAAADGVARGLARLQNSALWLR